jgi:TolB-like protein
MEIERNPAFNGWLIAQRRRFRGRHAALLEHLVGGATDDEVFDHLEKWLRLAPFDRRIHGALLNALARHGRIREGEEHLAATARQFEAEGLDCAPIRDVWRAARAQEGSPQHGPAPPVATDASTAGREESGLTKPRRASIAVMPFADQTTATIVPGGPADGLAHDVITRLAKLRSLFVIAQGTVFALRERQIAPHEAGRMLNVDYVVSGSLRRHGKRLTVTVELAETRTARIVWAEVFDRKVDDAFLVLGEIGNRIVASIAHEIETAESNRAILRPPSSLDGSVSV